MVMDAANHCPPVETGYNLMFVSEQSMPTFSLYRNHGD